MRALGWTVLLLLGTTTPVMAQQQATYCVQQPYGLPPLQTPFICSRADAQNNSGPSLNWPSRAATFKINQALSADLVTQDGINAIRNSFDTWHQVAGGHFTYTYGGLTQSTAVGYDFLHTAENENIVIFQKEWNHDSLIIGLTTATYNAQTGEVFDADIELNNRDYTFSTDDNNVQTDLQNTVTHEAGHFIGFDHTDKPGSTLPTDCATAATMSRTTKVGEISKRVLAASDKLGFTFVYPSDKAGNGFCWPATTSTATAETITQTSSSLGGCMSIRTDLVPVVLALIVLRFWLTNRKRRKKPAVVVPRQKRHRWSELAVSPNSNDQSAVADVRSPRVSDESEQIK